MNASHLRTTLRTGGWTQHAANLPSRLLEHGVPFEASHKGHTLRISLDSDGCLVAHIISGRHGAQLVATESQVLIPIERAPAAVKQPSLVGSVTGVRLSSGELNRLATATRRTGQSRSEIIRRALRSHLDAMGVV